MSKLASDLILTLSAVRKNFALGNAVDAYKAVYDLWIRAYQEGWHDAVYFDDEVAGKDKGDK